MAYSIPEGFVILKSAKLTAKFSFTLLSDKGYCYTADGKLRHSDAQPSLYTEEEAFHLFGVRREKKKVKKRQLVEVAAWADIYKDGLYLHENEASLERFARGDAIAIVKLTGSYEIEVEE